MKSLIRLRMASHDAHYGGNLVDGARMLQLFGDVATAGRAPGDSSSVTQSPQ